MDQLFTQIEQHITQLFPETISKNYRRTKRGLINFLGSTVKAITGNLDSEDGQRYETLISQIQTQQDKQKILLDEQISLTTTAIEKFNESIARLTINQQIFKKKITEIESIINRTISTKIEIYPLLHLHTVFLQMITISQEILRILEEIETAISFAKLNTLHNSIIDPKDLLNELKIVENKLDKKSLAYEANEANLLTYERIIQIKAYQKDLHITFIFEIPLTEPHNYNFYQLYPFPIQHDSKTYQIIIPSHKYLYLNELYFSLNDDKCNEVTPGDYICNLPQTSKISKEAPCEIQLLKFSKNYQQCKIIKVNLKNTKIRKIDKNQWIGIFPIEQPATSTCGQQEEHLSVKGSYVITVPDGCKLRINSTTLQSYQNPEFKKQSIQTPKLEISSNTPLKEEI